jgi:glycosyltransferase involved in cell wall biosynthesis
LKVWIIADIPRAIPGGMLRHMQLHAEGLRRLGHEASLFCSEDFRTLGRRALDARLPGTRSVATLLGRARQERPNLLNVHTLTAPAWIAAQQLGLLGDARVVVMSYGADERTTPIAPGVRGQLARLRLVIPARTTLPRAAGFWCVNSEDRAFVMDRYRLPPERVALIPHAVDDLFYDLADAPPREPERLLFVGTWIKRKGTELLAAALPRVCARRPALKIVLAGTIVDEPTVRATLPAEIQGALTVCPVVTPEALRRLYRESTMLLVPSELEGLPIVMLEAMASGCPPLAAANSGMVDVIRDGRNGWLLATRAPAVWADRIEALLADTDALTRAGGGARVSGAQFRIEPVTEEAVAFYRRLGA